MELLLIHHHPMQMKAFALWCKRYAQMIHTRFVHELGRMHDLFDDFLRLLITDLCPRITAKNASDDEEDGHQVWLLF